MKNLIRNYSMLVILILGIILNLGCEEKNKKETILSNKKIVVEILYMDHGPVQPILKAMRSEFEQFADKVDFKWFDFDNDLEFKKEKGIDSHIPIVIWINNSNTVKINGEQIKFSGFPSDQGPKFARGQWKVSDLIAAIKNILGEK